MIGLWPHADCVEVVPNALELFVIGLLAGFVHLTNHVRQSLDLGLGGLGCKGFEDVDLLLSRRVDCSLVLALALFPQEFLVSTVSLFSTLLL